MIRGIAVSVVLALASLTPAAAAQAPDRILMDAMRSIVSLRNYTAFDWIAVRYLRGTLTIEGFVRTPQLKQQAEAAARKVRGVEVVENELEVLPAHSSDDDIRVRAYVAIFGSSALERYGPVGQLSDAAISELIDSARLGLDATDVGRGPHAIHIIVSAARVLLLGEVRTSGDRQIAEATVRSLPGVLGVTNQLRLPPKP